MGGKRRGERRGGILGVADQHRPLAQERVGAGRAGVERVAGNGHDHAGLVERGAGGDEAARPFGGLDHDHAEREASDDPVADREMAGLRSQTGRVFGEQRTARGDLGREGGVLGGVDDVDPAGHRGHRAGGQCRGMGGGIDAAGQPRDHDEARHSQTLGQPTRHPQAQRGGVAHADQCHHRPDEKGRIA